MLTISTYTKPFNYHATNSARKSRIFLPPYIFPSKQVSSSTAKNKNGFLRKHATLNFIEIKRVVPRSYFILHRGLVLYSLYCFQFIILFS
jgi:hypothetical protein